MYPGRRAMLADDSVSSEDLAELEAWEEIGGPLGLSRLDDLFRYLVRALCCIAAHDFKGIEAIEPVWWKERTLKWEEMTPAERHAESEAKRREIGQKLKMVLPQ